MFFFHHPVEMRITQTDEIQENYAKEKLLTLIRHPIRKIFALKLYEFKAANSLRKIRFTQKVSKFFFSSTVTGLDVSQQKYEKSKGANLPTPDNLRMTSFALQWTRTRRMPRKKHP